MAYSLKDLSDSVKEDLEDLTGIYKCGITSSAISDYYGISINSSNRFIRKVLSEDSDWELHKLPVSMTERSSKSSTYSCLWPKSIEKGEFFGKRLDGISVRFLKYMWPISDIDGKGSIKDRDIFDSNFLPKTRVKKYWNAMLDSCVISGKRISNNKYDIVGSEYCINIPLDCINPYLLERN